MTVWIPVTINEDGEVQPNRFGERIPDSPALPMIARWLAEHGDTFSDLVEAGVFCLDIGGEIIYNDRAYQMRVIVAGRKLLSALEGQA